MGRPNLNKFILSFAVIFLGACARAPIKSVDQAMRLTDPPQKLRDDLGLLDLSESLQKNIARLKTYGSPLSVMKFGPVTISKNDYIEAIESLILALNADSSGEFFIKTLRENFEFYEVYGNEKWGEVLITSYYEPVIQGSLKKQKTFTQPLYSRPDDLVTIDLGEFANVFPNLRPYQQAVIEQQSRGGILHGRIQLSSREFEEPTVGQATNKTIEKTEETIEKKIVPYFSRQEIDLWTLSDKHAQVICYVDPIDAFFLQIQGSGRVILPDNSEIKVGYAAQNGYPYKAIGRLLFDVIPKESMSMQKIEAYLRSLPEGDARKIMNTNPSYVFFQKRETEPLSAFGAEVVSGRTIATDQMYFPKGTLAYLEYDHPDLKSSSRFVLDQDTGGAIRGPGRVDLFWGQGNEAAKISGVMRNQGRLYYMLPKKVR